MDGIMTKNDNVHSVRLIDSLIRNAGNKAADEFEETYPLSKSANIVKKYEWALNVCDYLEKRFDTETIIAIRKECRCNDGKSIATKIIKYLNKVACIEDFVEAFNENETFTFF